MMSDDAHPSSDDSSGEEISAPSHRPVPVPSPAVLRGRRARVWAHLFGTPSDPLGARVSIPCPLCNFKGFRGLHADVFALSLFTKKPAKLVAVFSLKGNSRLAEYSMVCCLNCAGLMRDGNLMRVIGAYRPECIVPLLHMIQRATPLLRSFDSLLALGLHLFDGTSMPLAWTSALSKQDEIASDAWRRNGNRASTFTSWVSSSWSEDYSSSWSKDADACAHEARASMQP